MRLDFDKWARMADACANAHDYETVCKDPQRAAVSGMLMTAHYR